MQCVCSVLQCFAVFCIMVQCDPFRPKSLVVGRSTKEPYIPSKEPYILTKEPYIFSKEGCISAEEPCVCATHINIFVPPVLMRTVQPCIHIHTKEPYISAKMNYVFAEGSSHMNVRVSLPKIWIQKRFKEDSKKSCILQPMESHCNTLQYTATHCNTLQHTATPYLWNLKCHSISISNLNLIGLFSAERGKRDLENLMVD